MQDCGNSSALALEALELQQSYTKPTLSYHHHSIRGGTLSFCFLVWSRNNGIRMLHMFYCILMFYAYYSSIHGYNDTMRAARDHSINMTKYCA